MRKLKKQLKKLRKGSAPADGFKAALWAELDYEFDKVHPRPSFSFNKFIAMPIAGMAIVTLMGTGAFAYASPAVNSEHTLYPAKMAIENVQGVFYRTPDAKAKYQAQILARRIEETEFQMRNTKVVASVDLNFISDEFNKVIMAAEKSDDREDVMAHLTTSNVRYLHIMREAITNEIDMLEAEEVIDVIIALEEKGIAVTSVDSKTLSVNDEQKITSKSSVTKDTEVDATELEVPEVNVAKPELTESQKKVEDIAKKLDEMRMNILDSDLSEEEKRALLREFEQKLLERYVEIESEVKADFQASDIINLEETKSSTFNLNFIKR